MPPSRKNIVLTGMPAVGKSTIGVLLAKCLGMAFIDTDIVIQTAEQKTLQALIATHGLQRFCDLEAHHICALDCTNTVIATGGSVVYRERAMQHLAVAGRVVYLEIDLASLESRLNDINARGVVCSPGQTLADLYAERLLLYRKTAHLIINAAGATPDQLVGRILAQLA